LVIRRIVFFYQWVSGVRTTYPLQVTAPVTDFAYGGMFYNADSGLYLTKHRAYDPVPGRWLARDPLGETTDPAGNLYPYVGGNPISLTDRTGLSAFTIPTLPNPLTPQCDDGGSGSPTPPSANGGQTSSGQGNGPSSEPPDAQTPGIASDESGPVQEAGDLGRKIRECILLIQCYFGNVEEGRSTRPPRIDPAPPPIIAPMQQGPKPKDD
jgi:RHS repeat-associated protein